MTESEHEPDPQQDEEHLFAAAIRLTDPVEKDQYLRQACGGNKKLRKRIEARLRVTMDAPTEFLERSAIEPIEGRQFNLNPSSIVPESGGTVGPYELDAEIGRGMSSVVYKARQTDPLRRDVALKVLVPGLHSEHFKLRIELERQALAMMDHPNIAKIFDTGVTESGLPYLAMELIDGPPISVYCDSRNIGVRERLELFQKVCRGVEHAHQKEIIHRDLKPSNVLVAEIDGEATPKVIDFGIAKALEGSQLESEGGVTIDGDILGTPEFMSPEQLAADPGKIDTRTDVYSLGVLLYELLTGTRPFECAGEGIARINDIVNQMQQKDPAAPSTRLIKLNEEEAKASAADRGTDSTRLLRELRGDLDWIVLKALNFDPERRYATASELSADIGRYLRHETIKASQPSIFEHLRKFARRKRKTVTAALLVFAALAVSLWQASRVIDEAENARVAAQHRDQSILDSSKDHHQAAMRAFAQRRNAEVTCFQKVRRA